MIQLAILGVLALSQQAQQQDTNVWFCPNIDVTGNTKLDHSPSPNQYDIRDAFGGSYGNVPHEGGRIVFEDDSGGPGHPDFIEWNTKDPVVINRLVFSWQDDSPGKDWRNLSHFWIYARPTGDGEWKILWQENTPSRVGRFTMTKSIHPEQFQYFRAEFIRGGADNATAVAPRIIALEAYGHAIHD